MIFPAKALQIGASQETKRAALIFSDRFVEFFYSGLGCALALAGVLFAKNYLCYKQLIEREQAI